MTLSVELFIYSLGEGKPGFGLGMKLFNLFISETELRFVRVLLMYG